MSLRHYRDGEARCDNHVSEQEYANHVPGPNPFSVAIHFCGNYYFLWMVTRLLDVVYSLL